MLDGSRVPLLATGARHEVWKKHDRLQNRHHQCRRKTRNILTVFENIGRGERTCASDPLVAYHVLYAAEPLPDCSRVRVKEEHAPAHCACVPRTERSHSSLLTPGAGIASCTVDLAP